MLDAIREFFDRKLAPRDPVVAAEEHARLAAAALFVEIVRSDEHVSESERVAVIGSVRRRFNLDPHEAEELLALAEAASRDAHDLYQFTSAVNAGFLPEQKARLIEELWRAAYADAVLHKHEEHLIRRIASLLHVPHSTFIAAKLRARESLGNVGARPWEAL
jgi:uncharacterized tellurite resistance protein B-like protein